jgi:molybdate transport system ATP-binding protein
MTARLSVSARLSRGAFTLDVALSAPLDGVTALFGPSGAGKSLLLQAIAGLQHLDAGRIAIGERALDDTAADIRAPPHRRGVGLAFQDARLFPHLSVRENLVFAQKRAPVSKQIATLEEIARQFDISALLERRPRALSGGEKSRVALARAILSAPDLLLLDEPFAALDGPRRRAFLEILRAAASQFRLPMIIVTHQIDDAAYIANEVVALAGGKVVAQGPIADVAQDRAFHALLAPHDLGAPVADAVFAGAGGGHWLRADHVLLASEQPRGLSARNIWPGRVRAVERVRGAVEVWLDAQPGFVLARVTPEAARELAVTPGAEIWAIVKAHAM